MDPHLSPNLHEEVAECTGIWSGGADQVVEIRAKRDTDARRSDDVYAVALPVAIVAKVDAVVCALDEVSGSGLDGAGDDGRGRSRKNGGEDGEDGGCEELHFGFGGVEGDGGDFNGLLRETKKTC